MDRRARIALLLVVSVLLVVAGVVAGTWPGDDGTAAGGPGAAGAEASGGGPGAAAPAGQAVPDLDGQARSLHLEGRIIGLQSVRLAGPAEAVTRGRVRGGDGRPLGEGSLTARGELAVTGSGLSIDVAGAHLSATEVVLDRAGERAEAAVVRAPAAVRLDAADLVFEPSDGGPRAAVAGPATVEPEAGETEVRVGTGPLRWIDAPTELVVTASGRTTMSWAGGGVIRTGQGEATGQFLGVKASRLSATVTREATGLRVTGHGTFAQVYSDGLPQLRATGTVRVKQVPSPVPAGARGWIRWAPENTGRTDLVISRIAPGSPAGSWVNLALDPLPEMCGGEACPRVGGDTTGLGNRGSGGLFGSDTAQPIDAVILPRTGDESEISFDVPAGTPPGRHVIVLVLEGNFEPMRVEIPVEVR